MKSKNGGFFGIFKKKSTPAPIPVVENENETETTVIDEERRRRGTMIDDEILPNNIDTTNIQHERKSSIAKTSVLHYSPPGSTIVTVSNSSATTSTSGSQKDSSNNDEMIRVTRKSNIILDDEESVISTPISQYDDSEILPPHNPQRKKKRAAPPPPPASSQSPIQSSSSLQPPPPLPRHSSKKNEEEQDVEEMFQNLQKKFDTWHAIRLEEGGSIREEKIKAEVLREHNQLREILEKQDNGFVPIPVNSSSKKQQHLPLKIPQFNVAANKPKQISPSSTSSTISPRSVDENRNVVPKTGNTEAIARLKKEVEQQRKREKEVNEYRSIKPLTSISKTTAAPAPPPQKQISPVARTPRIIEYHPMRNTIDNSSDASSDSDYSPKPPPIPNTPPPKLAEYRKNVISPTVEENKGKGIYQRINNNNNISNKNMNVKPMISQGFYVQSTVTKRSDSPVIIRKTVEAPKPQPIKIVNLPAPTMSPPMPRKEQTYRKINIPAPVPPTTVTENRNTIYQKINIPRPATTNPRTDSEYQKIKITQTSIKDPIYQKINPQIQKPTPVVSATSIPYKKPVLKSASISKPQPQKDEFVISDILRAPKLRKVGMPVERSGISLGKVVDAPSSPSSPSSQSRPTGVPPPPPPPPPTFNQLPSPSPIQTVSPPKNMDARDSLMHEIREAGRLRAARASQNA
ncbi:unnamed protein product [Caenorhabditis angaria]|uniref:WH2 domain-containing protein n=1 Tax=Caenorhabditis angaria TaxID=860376 RepID=A0A9P1IGU7_9PELO|nr:unnamed protein product [Caenorhabditis angaria]